MVDFYVMFRVFEVFGLDDVCIFLEYWELYNWYVRRDFYLLVYFLKIFCWFVGKWINNGKIRIVFVNGIFNFGFVRCMIYIIIYSSFEWYMYFLKFLFCLICRDYYLFDVVFILLVFWGNVEMFFFCDIMW